jgi:hypothetical protein
MLLLSLSFYLTLTLFFILFLVLFNLSTVFRIIMRLLGRAYGSIFRTSTNHSQKDNPPDHDTENLNQYSFSFSAKRSDADSKPGYFNIPNPFRGIFVVGGAGSGKSETFANSLIWQSVAQGYSGILYDFKYPTLTRQLQSAAKFYQTKTRIATINFEDLKNTHRVNPLHPRYIKSISHAEEYATAIINNLMPESIQKTDFWIRSSIAILQAAIWYFKEEHTDICDLPHIVSFLQSNPTAFLALMRKNEFCEKLLSSILSAHDQQAENQLAGTIGTLQLALNKISIPEISYVLSNDDFSLDLNDPAAPVFLALANTPSLMDTYGPVLSLIATVCLKMMNQDGKAHSIVLLDEAPTIYIPKLETVPATGRSRKIAVVFMCQDFSQITDKYGQTKKETIVSSLANQFYGRVSNVQTAEYISKLFGRKDFLMESRSSSEGIGNSTGAALSGAGSSSSNKGESNSFSFQEREILKPQAIFAFSQGRFASMIAERGASLAPLFIADYERFQAPAPIENIPPLRQEPQVMDIHRQINQHIRDLFSGKVAAAHLNCKQTEFTSVLATLLQEQVAIKAMSVQYMFADSTCPLPAFNYYSNAKTGAETWFSYCKHTNEECTKSFNKIASTSDLEQQAIQTFALLRQKKKEGIILSDHLSFHISTISQEANAG